MATTADAGSGGTDGGVTGAKKPFGAPCTTDGANGDCQSGLCKPFVMMTILRCTKPCTAATQATDCPVPPSAGTCTPNLYCKFTQ
jgi:hypothetical protein